MARVFNGSRGIGWGRCGSLVLREAESYRKLCRARLASPGSTAERWHRESGGAPPHSI